ncbi:hypothetical protein VPH35_071799 [Triticum aestivum]
MYYLFSVLNNVLVYVHLLITKLFPFSVFSSDGRGSNVFPVRMKINFQKYEPARWQAPLPSQSPVMICTVSPPRTMVGEGGARLRRVCRASLWFRDGRRRGAHR